MTTDAIEATGITSESLILPVDAERPPPAPGNRWRTGFSWRMVDRELLEALLGAVHVDQARPDRIGELSDFELAQLADGAFGARIPKRAYERVTPVLKARWLPHAPDVHLEALVAVTQTALGAAWHKKKLEGRKSRVAFLQERRNTNNFRTNLVSQFHSAHRGAWQVDKNEAAAFNVESPRRLVSEGLARGYPPYPHAEEAWNELRRRHDRGDAIRGLIVLPTGAGKTDVAVEWVLARLAAEEDLGVLWLAHQVALLEQAAARFQGRVLEQAVGLEKTLRIFCAGGDATTLLHPKHTDVALATIQTLSRGLGRGAKKKRSKQLAAYLARPTIVVIDEAHHVAARGYQLLHDFAADRELKDMLGLTATPWHFTEEGQGRIDRVFPETLIERSREELIRAGVLAEYDLVTVKTNYAVDVSDQERRDSEARGDFVPAVLRRLETEERNELIVRSYRKDRGRFGRTLVFTTTIANADSLVKRFRAAGVPNVEALHSRSGTVFRKVRDWFDGHDDAVLISVGMLLEGVDLPKARTALIGRPTTSPTVLTQMIGRVLRGRAAGGDATAHVVYLEDDFGGLLVPKPVQATRIDDPPPAPGREPRFPLDLAAEVAAMLAAQERSGTGEEDGDDGAGPVEPLIGLEVALESRRVVAYLEVLDGRKIPVFDHQLDAFRGLMACWADDAERDGDELLDDLAFPRPAAEHLDAVREAVALAGAPLPLISLAEVMGPRVCAERLEGEPGARRGEVLAEAYEDPYVRAVYPSLAHFEEAVVRAERRLRHEREGRALVRPEEPLAQDPETAKRLPLLPRDPDRSLDKIVKLVMTRAESLLPRTRLARLTEPSVRWTTKVERSKYADWHPGDGPGEQLIRINRLLQTNEEHVSDELLGFLLWHELLHGILRGQGHDAEFESLELLWPDAIDRDAELDALMEHWSVENSRYAESEQGP